MSANCPLLAEAQNPRSFMWGLPFCTFMPCALYETMRLCSKHIARALHNAQHSKSSTIEEHSLNCISVPNFVSLPQSFPKVKVPMQCTTHLIIKCNMYHRNTYIELHQRTKFGVASSILPRTGGPLSNTIVWSWRVQPAPHKYANQNSSHIAVVHVWPASLGPAMPFVWPVGAVKEQKVQNTALHCTSTLHSSPLNRTAPSKPCQGLSIYRVRYP